MSSSKAMDSGEFAHHEDGGLTPVQHFDYELVDRNLFEPLPEKEFAALSQAEIDAALKLAGTIFRWVFQDGMKNPDGLKIRAIIVCWIFLKELRSLSLVEMATGFGMKKQSLGRWHDHFKLSFPRIRTPHMRSK